jgi:type II secretory pathway component PulC
MNYILKILTILIFTINLCLYNFSAHAIDEDTTTTSSDETSAETSIEETVVTEQVDDPFGETLPSAPDPEPEKIGALNNSGSLEDIEALEAATGVSSIEGYKLLSYMFSGTIIRSKTNRKAIVVAPNQDQYVLEVGDYFSSEDAVLKEINSEEVIVIDQEAQEYIFKVGRSGKKKIN